MMVYVHTHPNVLDGGMLAYRASKVMAERAAWEFVKEKQPRFDIVTICPPLVIGMLQHDE